MSEAHEAGIARFLTPRAAARWRGGARHGPDALWHFESRFDPAFSEVLTERHTVTVEEMLARLAAERAGETCVVFDAHGSQWGEVAAVAQAVPELMRTGAGILSFIAGRLALYVGEDGSCVVLLRREGVVPAG